MTTTLKSWATPLAIGAFTISTVTGLLIFFDIEIGMIEPVHKWLSWLLVAGVLFHVVANWNQFSGYFSKKPALVIIGAALLVTTLSMLPQFGDEKKENPGKVVGQLLEASSLETVALVVRSTPAQLIAKLAGNGIVVSDQSLTIKQIALNNKKSPRELLGFITSGVKNAGKQAGDRD